MPVCSPALLLTAATLTVAVSAQLPTRDDLTTPTWCFATKAGQEVESWSLKENGRADVTLHVHKGARVDHVFKGSTWALKRNKLVIRVPHYKRRVLTIEEFKGRRLHFSDDNQAMPCQPR